MKTGHFVATALIGILSYLSDFLVSGGISGLATKNWPKMREKGNSPLGVQFFRHLAESRSFLMQGTQLAV